MYGQMGKFPIFQFQFGPLAIKAMGILGNFAVGPVFVHLNYVLCMAKWEISNFSFVSLGSLATKVIAFLGNFTIGHAPYTKIVSYVWSSMKFLFISPLVWYVGCKCQGI